MRTEKAFHLLVPVLTLATVTRFSLVCHALGSLESKKVLNSEVVLAYGHTKRFIL